MSHLARLLFAVALGTTLFAAPAVAQPALLQHLTPEQQQMLNMLPPQQRDVLLRQFRQMQATQGPGQTTGETGADTILHELRDPEASLAPDMQDRERERIREHDTLLVNIEFPEDEEFQENGLPKTHLLLGRHSVKLDRFGRLSLPGIENVPVAGLNAEQAALRLKAERLLHDMEVAVTRLTLEPVGRAALKPFGYEIFSKPPHRIPIEVTTPVPGDYRVAPGDTVNIAFFGKDFSQVTLMVTREGVLLVPNLGPVAVAGMRYSEMKSLIESRVREQTIGVQASVAMGELAAIEVFVLGDVNRPGKHVLSSLASIVDVLFAAEGVSDVGSLRDMRILRDGELVARVDLYDLLIHGTPNSNLRLHSGDAVFVPPAGNRAGVMGEAQRPAWYELSGTTTAGELLSLAGGPSPEADLRRAQIERIGENGLPEFVDIDLTKAEGRATRLLNGDLLILDRITASVEESVALQGYFNQPGLRQWRDGLRIRDLVPGRTVLRSDPDLDYGLVVRQLADGRGVQIRVFSPRRVFAEPASPDNIELHPRDEILLFGFDDYIGRRALIDPLIERLRRQATRDSNARVAQIIGAVRAPGDYPLAENMTLSDLVRAGGGLDESAFLEEAEVTRFDIVDGHQREIEHLTVNIGRALDGEPDSDLEVRSNDALTIKQISLWSDRGSIELRGEVRFPGIYPIRPGEQLSDVLERAGGVTELAFPRAAVFSRTSLRAKERDQIEQMIRRLEADVVSVGTQTDPNSAQVRSVSLSLAEQLRNTQPVGRLVIDFDRIIANPGDLDADVLVHDGDSLVVPSRPQEVTVFGEVYFPTSHVYEPGLGHKEYLERSGGATYRADNKRIYVVRANGAVETVKSRFGRGNQIHPGDTIVVPLDVERLPAMVRLANISQIVYQLGVAAAAWNTIGVL